MKNIKGASTVNPDEKSQPEETEAYDIDYYTHEYSGLLEER